MKIVEGLNKNLKNFQTTKKKEIEDEKGKIKRQKIIRRRIYRKRKIVEISLFENTGFLPKKQ